MLNRRLLLKTLTATGIGTPVFHRALVSLQEQEEQQEPELSLEQIKQAEWVSGIELTDEEREKIQRSLARTDRQLKQLRAVDLDPSIGPPLHFQTLQPAPGNVTVRRGIGPIETAVGQLPDNPEDIAFLPVTELSGLVRTRQISSMDLTRLYLERLKKYAPMLRCVVNLTENLAMKQAQRADAEIAAGRYRGPLHGIPWGAKDLIAVPGYPTTWGIPYLKDQMLDAKATVAQRLEDAGAVLVAKLSLGALAMGDKWFEGMTRNPWNARVGSSGSSAGSASATVAGLVGFSIGSETLGSILSPSTRCGASGHRPTFGRVSRHGCMPLSWTMDKIGPICRSVEDCALVFAAIHGSDGRDPTVGDYPFVWPPPVDFSGMRVGIRKSRREVEEREDVALLKKLGCEIVPCELPNKISPWLLTNIINVEGASVFDQLLRDGHTDGWNRWTDIFRCANYISAVDYLRYQRARTRLMHEFEEFFADFDVLFNMRDLGHTNLTGHPSVVIPRGYRDGEGPARTPETAVFTGHLGQDDRLLAFARAYQNLVDAHMQRPPLDEWLQRFEDGTLDEKQGEDVESDGQ